MIYKIIPNTKEKISIIGQGTGIGGAFARNATYKKNYRDILEYGIDLGMNFIDTAEEYGLGEAEKIIGEVISSIRDKIFIATKISSINLKYKDIIKSIERSLIRLKIDYIDLYQIHWPNLQVSMHETTDAINKLLNDGKVRYVGVCNFSLNKIKLFCRFLSSEKFISIQDEYNLFNRIIENDIVPYCNKNNILIIAYSPFNRGKILNNTIKINYLKRLANCYNKNYFQIILNWLISHGNIIAIPQSEDYEHIKLNAETTSFRLSKKDLKEMDKIFITQQVNIPIRKILVDRKNQYNLDGLINDILNGETFKPIKVEKTFNGYKLIEGAFRYWAWLAAFDSKKPIPALIQE